MVASWAYEATEILNQSNEGASFVCLSIRFTSQAQQATTRTPDRYQFLLYMTLS